MIIMQMSGGLGNQMFQYALGVKLETLGRQVVWDEDTEYRPSGDPDRNGYTESGAVLRPKLLKQAFGIHCRKADEAELTAMKDADMHLKSRIRRKIAGRHSLEIRDDDFRFDPSFLEREEGYYAGCFQSARYFEGAEEKVRQAFRFRNDITEKDPAAQEVARRIRNEKVPVAVHLRYGDYLAKKDVYGGICTEDYYAAAVRLIRKICPEAVFYVFSNDNEKAGEWISRMTADGETSPSTAFVNVCGRDEEHGYIDLYLMHLCRHFIIANSSFSWWGAWLGKNREETQEQHFIISPSMWIRFKDGSEPGRTDIFTRDMIRISPAGRITKIPADEAGDPVRSKGIREYEPLISVIVAAYNIEQYIGRALESLMRQTWKNLEIIAVDDGSSDATGEICDEFALKDKRIHVIHKSNGGLSDARNAGLAAASGEYIGYLDGDDWADLRMYEIMARSCLACNAQMAVTAYRSVSESDTPKMDAESGNICAAMKKAVLLDKRKALQAYILSGISEDLTVTPFYNSVWSKLFSSDIVRNMRFPVGKNSEDILYTTKALISSTDCCYVPEKLYNYVEDRAGSIMNQKLGERRCRDEMPFWQEQIRLLEEVSPELADLAEFAYCRRLLYYEEEMRKDPDMRQYADSMGELLLKEKEKVLKLTGDARYGRRGDRVRLSVYLRSPALYRKLSDLYEKIVSIRAAGRSS